VQECLKAPPKTFYSDEIRNLADCWAKYIEKQSNCIAKYMLTVTHTGYTLVLDRIVLTLAYTGYTFGTR